MKKRILSAILAMTMTMSMGALTAFADDVNEKGKAPDASGDLDPEIGFTATGEVKLPTVLVTVPTTGSLNVDPYNLKQKGQIYSTEQKIINKSAIPVNATLVNVTAASKDKAGTGSGTVTFTKPSGDSADAWAEIKLTAYDSTGAKDKNTTEGIAITETATEAVALAADLKPFGGMVSYSYSGTCNAVSAAWEKVVTDEEQILCTNTFKFTRCATETYDMAKISATAPAAITVPANTMSDDVKAMLPDRLVYTLTDTAKTKIGIPVTWKADDKYPTTNTALTAASTYTFTAELNDEYATATIIDADNVQFADIYQNMATMKAVTVKVTVSK